jgi:hypothetical protein
MDNQVRQGRLSTLPQVFTEYVYLTLIGNYIPLYCEWDQIVFGVTPWIILFCFIKLENLELEYTQFRVTKQGLLCICALLSIQHINMSGIPALL